MRCAVRLLVRPGKARTIRSRRGTSSPSSARVEGLGGLALRIAMRLADDLELQALLHVVSSFDLLPAPRRRLEGAYEQKGCQLGRRSRKRRWDGRLRTARSPRNASAINRTPGASMVSVRRRRESARWRGHLVDWRGDHARWSGRAVRWSADGPQDGAGVARRKSRGAAGDDADVRAGRAGWISLRGSRGDRGRADRSPRSPWR